MSDTQKPPPFYLTEFDKKLEEAKEACLNSGQNVMSHFIEVSKMVPLGSGAERETREYTSL